VPLEHIADISSRLIVNRASLKMKHKPVSRFIAKLGMACSNAA
jgi:ATP phosphoribosyltransferase